MTTLQAAARTAVYRDGPSAPARLISYRLVPQHTGPMLDYGCGYGTDVAWLRSKGFDVVGWDPHYDDWDLDERTGYYDIVLCIYVISVLEEVVERQEVLTQMRALLRPGGMIYLAVRHGKDVRKEADKRNWERAGLDGYLHPDGTFEAALEPLDIMDLASSAGLRGEVLHHAPLLVRLWPLPEIN